MGEIRENLYMFDESTMAEHDVKVRDCVIEELREIFDETLFNRFAWDDGTMNFNNCSLMIRDILEKLKENNK